MSNDGSHGNNDTPHDDSAPIAFHDAGGSGPRTLHKPWKILVADDDPEVYFVTRLVLSDLTFEGRSVELLEARSGEEALRVLAEHPDTAVILLDVVMETEHAGLNVARSIRDVLGNRFVRIILRTGQPGQAPEKRVVIDYDINDYKEKTELTVQKLMTAVISALRSYRDILAIEHGRQGLANIIEASRGLFGIQSVAGLASGVLQRVCALMKFSEDGAPTPPSALIAHLDHGGEIGQHVVASGAGRFADFVGRPLAEVLDGSEIEALKRVPCNSTGNMSSTSSTSGEASMFIARFCAVNGAQNCIVVQMSAAPDEIDIDLLKLLAANIGVAFDNAHLYESLVRENNERRRAESALQESVARIRRLVESNIIGIFFWNTRSGITESNDEFLKIIGYSRQDLRAGRIDLRHITPKEYRGVDLKAIRALRKNGACPSFEKEFVRKDGSKVPVLVGVASLEGARDKGVAFVLDLTERKQAEAEREARRSAEAANEAKSEFLANMSHELRTPLNAILGFSRLISRQRELSPEVREDLAVILNNGEHLLTLINQVLDLSKIEAGYIVLNPNDFDLHHMISVLEKTFARVAGGKGLQLIVDCAPDVPREIRTDQLKLREVLINLVNNALKFTDAGTVTLRIEALPSSDDNFRLRFSVSDTGVGMAATELHGLFEAFGQTESGRRLQRGTGLGLKISDGFARLLGGQIEVDSVPSRGSTFRFDIVAQRVVRSGEARAAELASHRMTRLAPGQPSVRVLLVDDEASSNKLLARLLEPAGFEVRIAYSGREAVDICKAWRPALVWMDICMPEMSGIEAARAIKALPSALDTKIVALTANNFEIRREDVLAAGCVDILYRPFQEADLFAMLQRHLGVQYEFNDVEYVPSLERAVGIGGPDKSRIAMLPTRLAGKLADALVRLDSKEIELAIDEIAIVDGELAGKLRQLAADFKYGTILKLLQ